MENKPYHYSEQEKSDFESYFDVELLLFYDEGEYAANGERIFNLMSGVEEVRNVVLEFREEIEHKIKLASNWIIDHAEDDVGFADAVVEHKLLLEILNMIDGGE